MSELARLTLGTPAGERQGGSGSFAVVARTSPGRPAVAWVAGRLRLRTVDSDTILYLCHGRGLRSVVRRGGRLGEQPGASREEA